MKLKQLSFTVFYLLLGSIAFGQLGTMRIETPRFSKVSSPDYTYVDMQFNASEIRNSFKDIPIDKIESISLVYTQYKLSDRFNQLELNSSRIHRLLKAFPELDNNEEINWYWIAQTGCDNPGDCKDFFHGFEIKLKSEETLKKESYESSVLEGYVDFYTYGEESTKLDSMAKTPGSNIVKKCDTSYIEKRYNKSMYGKMVDYTENSKSKFLRKLRRKNIQVDQHVSLTIDNRNKVIDITGVAPEDKAEFEAIVKRYYRLRTSKFHGQKTFTEFDITFGRNSNNKPKNMTITSLPLTRDLKVIDSFTTNRVMEEEIHCYFYDTSLTSIKTYGSSGYMVNETVVTKTLDRNKQWKNCLVVTDVTGSMNPYLGQFLAWHKLNMSDSKNHDYVFFNDGNNMRDNLKVTGNVGGNYYIKTDEYDQMAKVLSKAKRKGFGGDGPENNIEAVLYGIEKNPAITEVIMIADNYATPRDLELMNRIKRPVHVIICGGAGGINTEYLNLARKTKGSIHTIEEDITDLYKVREGHSLNINGVTYTISNGNFIKAPADLTAR